MTPTPPPLLDSGYCRCPGRPAEAKCQGCLRRLQMERDPPLGWFPRIGPMIEDGRCQYHIPEARP